MSMTTKECHFAKCCYVLALFCEMQGQSYEMGPPAAVQMKIRREKLASSLRQQPGLSNDIQYCETRHLCFKFAKLESDASDRVQSERPEDAPGSFIF